MAAHGKKYVAAAKLVDRTRKVGLDEACEVLPKTGTKKFDETVDLAVRLNVNPKHADQMVRGACVLPAGTGKVTRVLVFAKGDKEKEAKDAGADYVGADELAEKIKTGWFEFDKAIATPDMMGLVGKLGKLLGTRGLMPNPKVGTVTMDVGRAVREAKGGKVEFRVEKAGIIHTMIGKKSFTPAQLKDNVSAVLETLVKLRPSTVKGTYVKSITLSTTMGPGIRIDPQVVEGLMKK
jgi:large subunit ribosomal protein L1